MDKRRIKTIPLFRSINLEDKNIKKISKKIIFFILDNWSHKNHTYVIDAMKILKEKHNFKIDFYFCVVIKEI